MNPDDFDWSHVTANVRGRGPAYVAILRRDVEYRELMSLVGQTMRLPDGKSGKVTRVLARAAPVLREGWRFSVLAEAAS